MPIEPRTYLGAIKPKKGKRFPDDHLESVSAVSDRIRLTTRCWVVLELDEVQILNASDGVSLAEIVDDTGVSGILVQTVSGDAIYVSGDADRLPALCKSLADELSGRFKKTGNQASVEYTDPALMMHVAIAESDVRTARRLLKAGLDPNGVYPPNPYEDDDDNDYGQSFLATAAILDEPEICEVLIESGASADEVFGDSKIQPLLVAAKHGAKASFRTLLKSTNRRFHAAGRQLLKESSLTDSQRELIGAIEWSLSGGDDGIEILKVCDEQLREMGRPDEIYGRLLHIACSAAQPAMVKTLLNNGAKIDLVDQDGATALFQCCDQKVCKLMLDAGANPNAKNVSKATPIMVIDWAKPLLVLLDHGAKANGKDIDGNGVILSSTRSFLRRMQRDAEQFAKYRKSEDKTYAKVLRQLIAGKARLNDSFEECGTTALMMLAELDFCESIRVFLKSCKASDIAAQNHEGKCAWNLAKRNSTAAKLLKC